MGAVVRSALVAQPQQGRQSKMADKTVWKKAGDGVALLAIASFADSVRAADGRNLDGVWQCRFLKAKQHQFESSYYSHWTFDATRKRS